MHNTENQLLTRMASERLKGERGGGGEGGRHVSGKTTKVKELILTNQ